MMCLSLIPDKIRSRFLCTNLITLSSHRNLLTVNSVKIESPTVVNRATRENQNFYIAVLKKSITLLDESQFMKIKRPIYSYFYNKVSSPNYTLQLTNNFFGKKVNKNSRNTWPRTDLSRRYYTSFDNMGIGKKIDKNQAMARSILGLPANEPYTYSQLRKNYFESAKFCHPDTSDDDSIEDNVKPAARFLDLCNAYELLLDNIRGNTVFDGFDQEEEIQYRKSCYNSLGTSAELVEEMKRDGMFLEWLQGRTGAARSWRYFFMNNGGLAPKTLRFGTIESGGGANSNVMINGIKRRRRRNI